MEKQDIQHATEAGQPRSEEQFVSHFIKTICNPQRSLLVLQDQQYQSSLWAVERRLNDELTLLETIAKGLQRLLWDVRSFQSREGLNNNLHLNQTRAGYQEWLQRVSISITDTQTLISNQQQERLQSQPTDGRSDNR